MIMKTLLLATIVSFTLMHTAQAQESASLLAERIEAEGLGWMLGKWKAFDDNGNDLTYSLQYDLDRQVVVSHTQASWIEAKGISAIPPNSGAATYVGFDNHGGMSTGTWSLDDGKIVLNVAWTSAEGVSGHAAYVHSQAGENRLKVAIHRRDEAGQILQPEQVSFVFTRNP